MIRLPLIDVVPRMQRMLSRPEGLRVAFTVNVVAGVVEGVALAALLPAVTALARDAEVWGLNLHGWLVVLAVLAVKGFALNYVAERVNYSVALDFLRSLHRLVGDQVVKQPLGWFAQPLAGALSRMVSGELISAAEIFAHMLRPLVSRSTAAVIGIAAAWAWDPVLGGILTVAVPVFILITVASTALMRVGRAMHEPLEVEVATRIVEFAQCQGAVRSSGRSHDLPVLKTAMNNAHGAKTRALWVEAAGLLLSGMVTQGIIVILITVTGILAVGGSLEVVPALAFMGLALRFTSTVQAITISAMALESRRPLLDGIDAVLTACPLLEPAEDATLLSPGTVEFRDVTFAYSPGSAPAVRDMSFTVAQGAMIALVGPSGSGKSTIARLVARFHDADSGEVRVGGVPVTEQTTDQLMAQLTMVFQDVYLFDDTLESNIAVGSSDATQTEIRSAAALAGVSEIVERLPGGWDARVGEGGRALSGGERQRVGIARALLKKTPIVLLDEATSALDVENEASVVAAVEALRERATIIVIAHRLSTITRADSIVSLAADGSIEAQGTHDELLSTDGTYARFWHRLRSAQGWQLTN